MNELERIEAQAIREVVALAGGRTERAGGMQCVSYPGAPIPELNRALPLAPVVDVAAVKVWFGGLFHIVSASPSAPGIADQLAANGYEPGYAWMKFERDASPAPAAVTDLRIEETLDREAFALTSGEGTGMPVEVAGQLSGVVGAPGWHCFVAWDGDEPAACGALYADRHAAWLGVGATRAPFRRRGAQGAILAARIEKARALGCRTLTTETGERVEGRADQSYRNILKAGFSEAFLRPNWRETQ